MKINIICNTYVHHDDGQITDERPLDFVINLNYSLLTYYSLNTRMVLECHSISHFENLVAKIDSETYGIDTALSRPLTHLLITSSPFDYPGHSFKTSNVLINHYHGLGECIALNHFFAFFLQKYEDHLHPADINHIKYLITPRS